MPMILVVGLLARNGRPHDEVVRCAGDDREEGPEEVRKHFGKDLDLPVGRLRERGGVTGRKEADLVREGRGVRGEGDELSRVEQHARALTGFRAPYLLERAVAARPSSVSFGSFHLFPKGRRESRRRDQLRVRVPERPSGIRTGVLEQVDRAY